MFLTKISSYNKSNKQKLLVFLKKNKKKSININYFISETISRNIWLNKFLNWILKKGKKYKYWEIVYKTMRNIKLYLRQQPITFFNKSLKVKTINFYFDVKQLILSKRIIYIPRVIGYKKNLNYSFRILMEKMWLFLKGIKNHEIYQCRRLNITEKITLFLVSFSVNPNSEKIMLDHSLKLNKIALRHKFNLFRFLKNKNIRKRKRKQKLKVTRIRGLYHSDKNIVNYKGHNRSLKRTLSRLMTKKVYKILSGNSSSLSTNVLPHKLLLHNKYINLERRSWQKKWKI